MKMFCHTFFRTTCGLALQVFALLMLSEKMGLAAPQVEYDITPRVLHVGEAASCSITVRGVDNPPTPGLPPMDGWQISMAGTEQSFSYGTAGSDSAITFRFRLVPVKTGTFTFGPFQYALGNNNTAELPAIEVRVLQPNQQGVQQETSQADLLFAVLSSSSTNLYSQQVFDITLTVYAAQGVNVGRDIALLNMPSSGISLQQFQELGSSREVVNNSIYEIRRFRAKATALTAGTFRFAPTVRLSLLVPRQQRRDPFSERFGGTFFDDFFGRHESQPVDVTPPPLEISVQALPIENQPPGFSGAVGNFTFHAQVRPSEVAAGDPITVNITISGDGNIENVSAPEIVAGNEFRIYEAKMVSRDIDLSRASGRKVFEQVLIPRSADVTNLPAITFSFFNPSDGAYRVLKQGPFPISVSPATGVVSHVVQSHATPAETQTQILGSDILYLKPAPSRWQNGSARSWYRSKSFFAIQLIPPLLLGLLFAFVRRRTDLEQNLAKARRQKASRVAREAIRRAEKALSNNNPRDFFEALADALRSYFGHRLNLAPGEVTAEVVLAALLRGGLDEQHFRELEKLLARCDEVRFAGDTNLLNAADFSRETLNTLHELLKKCEKIRV